MQNTTIKTLYVIMICAGFHLSVVQSQCVDISTTPFAEDFNGRTIDTWDQSSTDDFDWSLKTGNTPSRSTGPSDGKDGSRYFYTEATRNFTNTSILISPCIDLTDVESPVMTFDYHMYGSSMGSLKVTASSSINKGIADDIFVRSGDQGDQWHTAIIELSGYTGSQVTFEIIGETGRGFRSDIAIDNVTIADSEDCTLAGQACQDGDICTSGETYDKNCDCTGGLYTDIDEDGICAGQDEDDNNACIPIPNATCNTCENTISGVLSSDFGIWQQLGTDDTDWIMTTSATPSTRTGPSKSFTGSEYLFIESSGLDRGYPFKKASLISDCIDMSSINMPLLNFAYHMYGITMGTINVYVIDMNNDVREKVYSISGNQGDQWAFAYIDLRAYQNTIVKIVIEGVTGQGFKSDIAIDEITVSVGSEDYTSEDEEASTLVVSKEVLITNQINSIEQNIASSEMIVNLSLTDQRDATMYIYSQTGQLLDSEVISLNQDQKMINYDISKYTSGAYYMSVTLGEERLTSPILIAY